MKALACISLLFLSGCATVSMVSKEAVVESETSANASLLRESSESFKLAAVQEGWVSESRSLMDFANILFGGESEQTGRSPETYAELIASSGGDAEAIYGRIEADATKAADSLSVLQRLAEECAASGEVKRAELISYESALVVAQKSYRSFAKAAGVTGDADSEARAEAEEALAQFASVIDAARQSADRLAEAYASRDAGEAGTAAS